MNFFPSFQSQTHNIDQLSFFRSLLILFNSIKMGNESCSFPRISNKDITLPQLKERNSYGFTEKQNDEKVLRSIFSQTYQQNRKSKLPQIINNDKQQIFNDQKFKLNDQESLRLSVLFNFESNKIRIYTTKEPTDITSFIQLNIEYSYLTSVFFLLCRKQTKVKLLPRLIETQQTNLYGAYSSQLFCNGQKHQVIVDDRMPTHKDSFLYLRIVKGIELWPLILEKSWCKQIGSYQRAKGLSPEDAFEEITGIPAYTYTIKTNNRVSIKGIMKSAIDKRYWVALIARNGLSDLQNRQVFYMESIQMQDYCIMSPYVSFNFERYPQKRRGEVVVKQQDIFSHFEHVIVGFYKQNYQPISIPVTSKARQEMLFQLNIRNKEEVSIRFNQPYKGYFATNQRANYQYSPVLIELYQVLQNSGSKKTFKLVNFCQGCNRSLSGARSSQCSLNVMQTLQGKYIIRLQVGWLIQDLINSGNLVVYASEGNANINQLRNTQLLFKQIYPDIFQHQATTKIILHQHNLEVNTFDKEKTTLIMFHNVTNQVHHFQADFTNSKNIILRGKEIKDQYAYIRLQPEEKTIIEVLPKDLKKNIEIQNFQINKLSIKQ